MTERLASAAGHQLVPLTFQMFDQFGNAIDQIWRTLLGGSIADAAADKDSENAADFDRSIDTSLLLGSKITSFQLDVSLFGVITTQVSDALFCYLPAPVLLRLRMVNRDLQGVVDTAGWCKRLD